jgi:predicted amidophosphoribosyltransferase
MKGSELAVKSVYVRYCRTCNDKLVPDLNWRSSEVKTGDYLCKYCARKYDNEQKIKFHKKHPEYKKKEYLLHRVGYIARAAKRYKKIKYQYYHVLDIEMKLEEWLAKIDWVV